MMKRSYGRLGTKENDQGTLTKWRWIWDKFGQRFRLILVASYGGDLLLLTVNELTFDFSSTTLCLCDKSLLSSSRTQVAWHFRAICLPPIIHRFSGVIKPRLPASDKEVNGTDEMRKLFKARQGTPSSPQIKPNKRREYQPLSADYSTLYLNSALS